MPASERYRGSVLPKRPRWTCRRMQQQEEITWRPRPQEAITFAPRDRQRSIARARRTSSACSTLAHPVQHQQERLVNSRAPGSRPSRHLLGTGRRLGRRDALVTSKWMPAAPAAPTGFLLDAADSEASAHEARQRLSRQIQPSGPPLGLLGIILLLLGCLLADGLTLQLPGPRAGLRCAHRRRVSGQIRRSMCDSRDGCEAACSRSIQAL